jgi:hypothetical protein
MNEERISGIAVGNNYLGVDHRQVRRLSEKPTNDSWVLFQLTASFKLESSLCASSCLCVSRSGICYRQTIVLCFDGRGKLLVEIVNKEMFSVTCLVIRHVSEWPFLLSSVLLN